MILLKIIRLIIHIALIFALIGLLALAISGCSKTQLLPPPTESKYSMVVDHYTLDTSRVYFRYVQELGVLKPSEAIKIDTASDMWYINCATMDTLEHLYYKRNNIKIQPSKWPKK